MTVSERIPFSGLLLPLQKGYSYSCDRRTTDGMELLFISREDGRSRYYFESDMQEFDRKAASDSHTLTVYPRPNGDGEVSLLHLKRAATDRFFLFRMTKPGVTLTGKTLSIDFEAEALTDCEYSYDMLTTDEFSGEDILIAEQPDVCDAVVESIMTDKLRKAILKLTDEEQLLIYRHYTPVFQAQTLPKYRRITTGNQQANRQNQSKAQKSFRKLKNLVVAPSTFRHGK